MKAYKGFDKELKCRDFQFEIGKEFEEKEAELCNKGFHACENPIDVFTYYSPADSRYCEVELEDVSDQTHGDSKRCAKRIKIGAEVGIKGIVDAFVKFTFDKIDWRNAKDSNTGNQSAATNTGNYSAATNTGDQSAATNTGYQSAATNTGDQSAATNTGNQSAATNTGYRSAATVGGKDSVAIVTGYASKAKGALGCWIVVAERGEWNGQTCPILCVKTAKVDGETIKEDVFYKVVNGDWREAE
jgi:hypothetical protein